MHTGGGRGGMSHMQEAVPVGHAKLVVLVVGLGRELKPRFCHMTRLISSPPLHTD